MQDSTPRLKRAPLLTMAGIAAAHLFVFTPLLLFAGNAQEFTAVVAHLLGFWLAGAFALFLLLILPGVALRDPVRYVALLAMLGLLCWAQATLLVWDYGLLDGRQVDWRDGQWRGWLDALLWILAIAGALKLPRKRHAILFRAAIIVFLVHLVAACLAVYQAPGRLFTPTYFTPARSIEQIAQFSSKSNILHIVLDGLQSDVFGSLLEDPRTGPVYREAFEGFTYYSETLSAFPYTQFSVPSFLGGQIYDNRVPKDDFLDTVFSGKTIVNEAFDRGYEVDLLVGDTYLSNRLANGRYSNLINIDTASGKGTMVEAVRLLEFALFRAAPHFLKQAIYNRQLWLVSGRFDEQEHGGLAYFRHTDFLKNLIREASVARDAPVYKYIHVMNTHRPMVVDAQCGYAGRVLADSRSHLTDQSRCTLDTVIRLLKRLKDLGIYKDMLIVIHADHGGWVPNLRNGPEIRIGPRMPAPQMISSLASPLLAIKRPGASGPVVTLPTFASLVDLPDTIADVLGWDTSFGHRSLLEIAPGEPRVRRHYFSEWTAAEWQRQYARTIHEFLIDGSHYEVEWQCGATFEAPAR